MGLLRQLKIIVAVAIVALVGGMIYEVENGATPAASDRSGGAGGGGAGGGQGGPGGRGGERAVAVEVVPARADELRRRVEAVGTTRALQSIDVVPLAEGQIRQINVDPGGEIAAGEVIATLDSAIEEATLTEARAALAERRSALARSEQLARANSVTISQAALETLRAEVAVTDAAVQRAERTLADRTVRAPFDGVLGIRAVDVGARVDTSTVLTTLDDLDEVEIEFLLPETVYGQIRAGQPVEATSAAFPDAAFDGVVSVVDSRIDRVSRAFRVRARLPNPDRRLPAGMFMRLDLALDTRMAVVVPEEALLIEGGEPNVFVVVDGTAEQRRIEIGLRSAGTVEVVEGVEAGEMVVARGIQSLRDGAAVRVVGTDPAAPVPNGEPATDVAPTEVDGAVQSMPTASAPAAAPAPGAGPGGSRT